MDLRRQNLLCGGMPEASRIFPGSLYVREFHRACTVSCWVQLLDIPRHFTTLDRRLWALAWPLILTNITVPLLGLVDTAVLGHLPEAQYLGAVAIGANLFSVIYWTFGFMRMGTTGLAAQAYGRDNRAGLEQLLCQSLLVGVAIGLAIILLQKPLFAIGLWLMAAPPAITELAGEYLAIRVYSAPAVLCQYALVGWMIGTHYARGPMALMVTANLVNIVLDVLFVTVFSWNSAGVAAATLVAEYLAAGLGLWIVRKRLPQLRWRRSLLGRWDDYKKLFNVNRYIMTRTILLLLAIAFFTAQGARQGETVLAANAVLLTFLLLISNALDGFANGAEALAGETLGRGNSTAFMAVCATCLRWSLITAILITLVFVLGGAFIIDLLTSLEPVSTAARQYLPWLCLMPLVAVWSFLLDGIFIGATDTRAMQNTMVLSVVGVYLPLWWLTQGLGNHGLWLAMLGLMAARGLSLGWLFRRRIQAGTWFSGHRA